MIKLRSIKAKSIIFIFLITIMPILILGAAGILYFHEVIKQNIQNDFLGQARTVSDLTDNYMDRSILYLEGRAGRSRLIQAVEGNDTASLGQQVEEIKEGSPLYYWTFITDPAGKVIASHPYREISGNSMDMNYYAPGRLWVNSSFVGNPVVNQVSGRPAVFVGTPIKKNNTTTGILVGALDESFYYSMLNHSRSSTPGQCIFIVNESGKIIVHHDPEYVHSIKNYSAALPVHRALEGREGAMEYRDPIDGKTYLGAYAPIPEYHWGVLVTSATNDAYRPISDALKTFGVLLLLLALLAIPLAVVVGRHISRPIENMDSAVEKVAEERDFNKVDLDRYLPYDRGDELGNLARNFKYMSERLTAAKGQIMAEKKRADFYIDVMGHDINNLNQIILTNLELLQETNRMESSQNKFLDGAIQATKESADIVKNVKAIQKIYTEKPESLNIDLDEFVRECIEQMPRPADKKVEVRYAPRKGLIVKALPELKLAFCNVIGNAIKYSGPEVHIDIDIHEIIMKGKKYYATSITDDGKGIPDSIKQTLFERFRADTATPPGKGIGLYTSKALAEAFGGSLEVEDRVPGDHTKGTKVIITLPAVEGW